MRSVSSKAIKQVVDDAGRFDVMVDEPWLWAATRRATETWVTFVTGLLLEAFRSATDKVDLRTKVNKALLALSQNRASRDSLPKALNTRANQAMRFEVAV